MLKGYSHFLDVIEKVEKLFLAVTVAAMILVMGYQVILRYVFSDANAWSEELARYLFIFDVMIAAAIAARRNSHLQIDVLINCFRPQVKRMFTIVATLLGMVFLCFLFKYSIDLCITATSNVSAGLHLSMAIPYASMPLGIVLMLLTSAEVVFKNIVEFRNKGEEVTEA